jgi:hypothetical protein
MEGPKSGTPYTVTVTNTQDTPVTVAMFQTYPDPGVSSVVWFSQVIGAGVEGEFSWDIDWSLTWGLTDTEITNGVQYKAKATPVGVIPRRDKLNSVVIDYQAGSFNISDPSNNPDIKDGQLFV